MPDKTKIADKYSALASWVGTRVEAWVDHRDSNYKEKWEEYYRLWRGIYSTQDKTRQSEKSQLISPALTQAIEGTVSELEEATFGKDQWFDMVDDLRDQDPTDLYQLRRQLAEDLEREGIKSAISTVFLNGALYGTGIGKIVLQVKTEYTIGEAPVGETYVMDRVPIPQEYICCKLEPIAPFNFAIDPTAKDIESALGCAHILIKPRHNIIENINQGIYRDVALGSHSDEVDIMEGELTEPQEVDDKVKITEYYGLVPRKLLKGADMLGELDEDEGDDLVEAIVTIANDDTVLRAIENPFLLSDRPFIAYQHDTVPDRFWGRGVAEKGYNPQKALDAELRARIDALALTTHPMMAIDATRLPRGSKFEVRAGKTILTNGDPRSVLMPINFGNTSPQSYTESAELERMIQMGTGAMDSQVGTASQPRNNTASGMSMMMGASIKRQKRTLSNFQENFLVPLINKSAYRYMQFDPERYPAGDYKFKAYSTLGIMARELEMSQLIQLLSFVPPQSPVFMVLLRSIYETSSLSNREEVLATLQQMQQPNPQQQQMQQQTQMLDMAEKQAKVQKLQAVAMNQMGEAQKAPVEAEHLESEIALNMAKAVEAGYNTGLKSAQGNNK